jgi:cytochrome c2
MNNSLVLLLKTIAAISSIVLLILAGFFCYRFISMNPAPENVTTDAIDVTSITLSPEETAGESLFNANCTACHAISERVIGPPLKDVHKRHSPEWLAGFIKNSAEMIGKGDPEAVRIYKEYNEVSMTSFANLSEKEIQSILLYLQKMSIP